MPTLDVPGARIHYEVRGSGPVLMLLGAPMGGTWFGPLAAALEDAYTVVTYDPRGISKSQPHDRDQDVTPATIADDVHHVLAAVTDQPADVFGSSGGAISGLAFVAAYPDQVRRLVAHEPPLIEVLPDRAERRAQTDQLYAAFQQSGPAAAWPHFFALVAPPSTEPAQPAAPDEPDDVTPSAREDFPMDAEAQANDEFFFGHLIRPLTRWQPPIEALKATGKVVVAGGSTNPGELAQRAATELAVQLGTPYVPFPGDHGGFMGETTEAFAKTLRDVLA